VIVNAVNPFAAQFTIMHAAHEGGVLAWHRFLIAVTVQRPCGDLIPVEFAAMQKLMKDMLVVISLGADGADRRLEIVGRQRRDIAPVDARDLVHRLTSMPSSPTSQPAACTVA
jgi:hypothetical protein